MANEANMLRIKRSLCQGKRGLCAKVLSANEPSICVCVYVRVRVRMHVYVHVHVYDFECMCVYVCVCERERVSKYV